MKKRSLILIVFAIAFPTTMLLLSASSIETLLSPILKILKTLIRI